MKNTLIIILLILLILGGAWYVFKPVQKSENEIRLEADKEKLQAEFSYLEKSYQIRLKEKAYLEAELLKSRAVVKRSEDQLNKAKANEKVYLKRIKKQTLAMSEIQADSVIKLRYQSDPDSIPQKVVVDLAQLDQSNLVRLQQDSLLSAYRKEVVAHELKEETLTSMVEVSRAQVSLLQSSSQIDKQLLGIKDTKIKKTTRQNRFLKGGIVGAIGVIVALIVKR